jgi:hypothetical protein
MSDEFYTKMKINDDDVKIYGNDKWIEIEYDENGNPFIFYDNENYYINDYMILEYKPFSDYFDGYSNDTVFSGTFIKISNDNDSAKIFFYRM